MAICNDLGTRMKMFYEQIPQNKLMRRTPVIIRLDGWRFHNFAKGFVRPYDTVFRSSMDETMKYLCEDIPNCVFGYCQSDEITLILVDYKNLNTDAWFDYEVQKLCSITASMATMAFNECFNKNVTDAIADCYDENCWGPKDEKKETYDMLNEYHLNKVGTAMFDSRCFNIPKEEVANLIYWRQLDAIRNSIQMAGQCFYTPKKISHKNTEQIIDMLKSKGIDWNEYPTAYQRGTCCIKAGGKGWIIDRQIPLFKGEDREYIERFICFEGEDNK